ncbi:MAG: quinoprotein dehydrogenase-associated putative ABC transporter substrate-binding protein [Granulosicoccaceae bacterium]
MRNYHRNIVQFTQLLVFVCVVGNVYAAGSSRQALTTSVLRVCADPANLPFSNEKLEGFENKIIALIANRMELEVQYTWFPQTIGFVRNTLRMRDCDLISGITTTSELVQNTNPYYHSAYVMVYRKDSGISGISMSEMELGDKKLGVIAGTPPANLIAQHGLLKNIKPYQLVADTRHHKPARLAVSDVVDGTTDVAFVWGPLAAFHAREFDTELVLIPMVNENSRTRLTFRVSMAVRYNETDWKHNINAELAELKPQIDTILHSYDVPLMDEKGQPLDP